jgi:hypothetical protein
MPWCSSIKPTCVCSAGPAIRHASSAKASCDWLRHDSCGYLPPVQIINVLPVLQQGVQVPAAHGGSCARGRLHFAAARGAVQVLLCSAVPPGRHRCCAVLVFEWHCSWYLRSCISEALPSQRVIRTAALVDQHCACLACMQSCNQPTNQYPPNDHMPSWFLRPAPYVLPPSPHPWSGA